jgi:hypothetical protein
MSQKQKVFAGIAALIVIVALGFLYNHFSKKTPPQQDTTLGKATWRDTVRSAQDGAQSQDAAAVVVPVTPDSTVDAIINDASSDDKALQNEVTNEKDAVTTSGTEINNLSQTYDESKL